MRHLIALLIALLTLPALAGCTTNPATGRKQFIPISEQEELALGAKAAPQFLAQNGGEIPSPAIQQYVRNIGARLAAASERPDLPWEFYVLDSQVINAFALPGGKVFFSRGLLEKMTNEAQVAAVMGHEVGHVTAKHIGESMGRQAIAAGLIGAVGVAAEVSDKQWMQVLGVGAQAGAGLYLLKFGRDQESEADRLGVRYMAQNGYNPVGMMQVMDILKAASGSGSSGIQEFLSTHPDPARRKRDAESLILKQYPDYQDFSKYRFAEDNFRNVVLANLAKLPPPRHKGRTAMLPPALEKAIHVAGGCACHAAGEKVAVAPYRLGNE
jgi:predicted Zn-dependent protease